jgi:ABC-type transporter MlaC component
MACPQVIVQLYKGLMKVYTNQTNVYKGSRAVVEHKYTRIRLEYSRLLNHFYYVDISHTRCS